MAEHEVDVVIIGGGPAGLAAGLYCGRHRWQTVILEKTIPGGQINLTDRIENYPGIQQVSGFELSQVLHKQAETFGAEIKTGTEVTSLEPLPDNRVAVNTDDERYIARVIILSPGSDYRKLGVPGEDRFREAGAGVSYCGTCDAPFFRDKEVIAIGGGNVAVEDTIHLARFCSKVTMVHRRQGFRAENILVEELHKEVKEKGVINLQLDTICTAINGSEKVESATLKNVKTGQEQEVPCDGVFIFVGMNPNTDFLKGTINLDENGFIHCDPGYLRTNVPGVFVAGDCRTRAPMQLATAIGDGVACAMYMKEYLRDPGWWHQSDGYTPEQ